MRRLTLVVGVLVVASGCDNDELRVSLVPKRAATPATATANHAGHGHAAAGSTPHWTLPSGWTQSPPKAGGMRFATLHAPAADGQLDLAVFRFPGAAGGLLANVNRWRGELGLEPATEESLAQVVSPVAGAPNTVTIDWVSSDGSRGLLAAIAMQPSEAWFFKAGGPIAQVAACRSDFDALIRSLHFAAPGAQHDHGAPAPGSPAAGSQAAGSQAAGSQEPASAALPAWTVPASWRVAEARPPRLASFAVGGKAEFAVTRFPGRVGGALANLNRWRQQVQLPPLDAEPVPEPRDVDGEVGAWIDLRGPSERMLICSAPHAGNTWFFKLRGPLADVDDAEAEFAEFVDSVRWPAAQAPSPAPAPTHPTPLRAPPPQAPAPSGPQLTWSLPGEWSQAAEAGRMRIATIRAGSCELIVTRFPGDVGGLLQNVNRWRLQIGLEPVLRIEDQALTPLTVDGLSSTRVDLQGGKRALRVILIPNAGQTWFVKLVGSPQDVATEEARFSEFVTTLSFREAK